MSLSVEPNKPDVNFRRLKAPYTYCVKGPCEGRGDTAGQGVPRSPFLDFFRDLYHPTQHGRTIIGSKGNGVEGQWHPSVHAVSHL